MKKYKVRLKGEITESVEANNEREAEQLAIRMVNVRMGNVGPGFYVSKMTATEEREQDYGLYVKVRKVRLTKDRQP